MTVVGKLEEGESNSRSTCVKESGLVVVRVERTNCKLTYVSMTQSLESSLTISGLVLASSLYACHELASRPRPPESTWTVYSERISPASV
jgi:hypothetical protein